MGWFEGFLRGGYEGQWKVAFLTIEKHFVYLVCYFARLSGSKNQAFSILDGLSCAVMSLSLAEDGGQNFQYLSRGNGVTLVILIACEALFLNKFTLPLNVSSSSYLYY